MAINQEVSSASLLCFAILLRCFQLWPNYGLQVAAAVTASRSRSQSTSAAGVGDSAGTLDTNIHQVRRRVNPATVSHIEEPEQKQRGDDEDLQALPGRRSDSLRPRSGLLSPSLLKLEAVVAEAV